MTKNHQKIRSRCLDHKFSFTYMFLTILILVTEQLFWRKILRGCFRFIWLRLLISIMKRCAEWCTLQLYHTSLGPASRRESCCINMSRAQVDDIRLLNWFIYQKYILYRYFIFKFQNLIGYGWRTWMRICWINIYNSRGLFCRTTDLFANNCISDVKEYDSYGSER